MNPFYCRYCGKKIPKWEFFSKIYCSDMCRMRSCRAKKNRNWGVYYEKTGAKTGRPRKKIVDDDQTFKNVTENGGVTI